MRGRRVTIKDIARQLKMSTSTVSRALSGHSDVSRETRQMVEELARKWDYQPDPLAVGLRQKKTNVIGVIIPQIVNRFFSRSISGIQEVARANGYQVMITHSEESLELEIENLSTMLNSRVDGLIVALSKQTSDTKHFQKVFESELPIVLFDRVDESVDTSRVIIDDYEASYNAIQHLIDQGCQHIAHIAGAQNLVNNRKRLQGYKDALAKNDLTFKEDLLIFSEQYTGSVKRITQYYLNLKNQPDAIFVVNDVFAIEMISYLKAEGIQIPKDMAIVGFNNEAVSQFVDPPLTSVDSPAYDLGVEAATLLLNHVKTEGLPTSCKILKSHLVIRESSVKH